MCNKIQGIITMNISKKIKKYIYSRLVKIIIKIIKTIVNSNSYIAVPI